MSRFEAPFSKPKNIFKELKTLEAIQCMNPNCSTKTRVKFLKIVNKPIASYYSCYHGV